MAGLPEEEQGSEGDLKWSDKYTVSELVDRYDMPCLVKVAQGVYCTENTESFSNGDLLKLHRCERLENIVAYPVGAGHTKKSALKDYKNISAPIFIPLDYRQKARILTVDGDTWYSTVQGLLADMPRYVEVGSKPIYGRHLKTREIVMVPARSPLELLHTTKNLTTKSVSLLCRYDKHELELEPECRGNFVAVRDPTTYTFREIVNRFCLPQLIELKKDFVEDEKFLTKEVHVALAYMDQFQGHFVLDRVEAEYKVLGTHCLDLENAGKPKAAESERTMEESKNNPPTSVAQANRSQEEIVIIPFTSKALFQVATNRKTSVYQSLISLKFRPKVTTVCLGGDCVTEVQGSQLSQTAESDYCYLDLATLDIPGLYETLGNSPPLLTPRQLPAGTPCSSRPPPRPARPPKKSQSDKYSKPEKSNGIDVIPISPPSIPPRTLKSSRLRNYRQPPPRPPGTKRKVSTAGKASTVGKVSPPGNISPPGNASPRAKTLPPRLKPDKKSDKPLPVVSPLASGSTPSDMPLDINRKGRKPTYAELAEDQTKPHKSKVSVGQNAGLLATGIPPTNEESASKQASKKQDIPLAGASGYSQPVAWSERLKTLSVEEVSAALGTLGLRKKVQPFVQMEIDGGYLQALFREQGNILQAEPFSLSSVEILKLKMYVDKGKVPIKK